MGNACVAFENLADAATILASSQELLAPAANLQHPDIARRWRGTETNASYFVADHGASVSIDTVAVIGTTMSAAGTARVRISSVDSSGAAGDLYDSAVTAVNSTYNQHVSLLSDPVTGRFVRVDLADAGADYLEAGRLFVGRRSQFAINFAYNWSIMTTDRSTQKKTRAGQTQVWRDNLFRTLDLTFEQMTETERNGFVETVERANAQKDDVLFIVDPDSGNLARDTIWGLIQAVTPIVNPYIDRFSKQYKIEERL